MNFRLVLTQEVPDNSLLIANILTNRTGIANIEQVNRATPFFQEIIDARQGRPQLVDNLNDIRALIGTSVNFIEDDFTGQIDGITRTFTVGVTPKITTDFLVLAGAPLLRNIHYTLSGTTLTLTNPDVPTPEVGDVMRMKYHI